MGSGERGKIDPAVADAYVATYLDSLDAAGHYPGLTYAVEATEDSVVVRVSAPLDLPLAVPGTESRPVITGTAAAYVVVSD